MDLVSQLGAIAVVMALLGASVVVFAASGRCDDTSCPRPKAAASSHWNDCRSARNTRFIWCASVIRPCCWRLRPADARCCKGDPRRVH